MGGFTKLFSRILTSSIWSESNEVRIVWITLLAATGYDGIARVTVPGLARLSNIPLDQTRAALAVLCSPDPDSRTVEHEGRRIREERDEKGNLIGYYVFNYLRHRAVDATAAERKRRERARVTRDGHARQKTEDRVQTTATEARTSAVAAVEVAQEREDERVEVAACRSTCAELTALTGKPLDEILYEYSDFRGRRLVRLETAPPKWLKVTHDRIRAAVIEAKRERGDGERPKGEDPLARIRRGEAERAERLRREGGAA